MSGTFLRNTELGSPYDEPAVKEMHRPATGNGRKCNLRMGRKVSGRGLSNLQLDHCQWFSSSSCLDFGLEVSSLFAREALHRRREGVHMVLRG